MKKQLKGIIISDKMQKTVVIKVDRIEAHPKYKKRYRVSRKYKAHIDGEDYHEGDFVLIEEGRPISKDKKWKVVKLLVRGKSRSEESESALLQGKVVAEGEEQNLDGIEQGGK